MPPKPNTQEQLQDALDLVTKHGSPYIAASHCDLNISTLRDRKRKALKAGLKPTVEPELPGGQQLKGTSTLYDDKGNTVLQWVKTKEDKERYIEKVRGIVDEFKEDLPKLKPTNTKPRSTSKQLMSIIPFGDPHFGMYAWADEVGNDFDLDIARRDLCGAVKYLVEQTPESERCIIVSLGDFFHADNLEGVTNRSKNVLDMDTRLPKVIQVGVAAMRQAIETALEKHKTVEVICCIGNHDEVLSMALAILLSHVYEKEKRVIVHDQPTRRHYIRHGKVLIGATHGHQTKDAGLPGIMATERPGDWGETKYRYFLRGHHHQNKRTEFNGCLVEQFRTLAPGDAYAVGHGFLSGQDMQAIVLHEDYGEVSRMTCSINLLRDLAK